MRITAVVETSGLKQLVRIGGRIDKDTRGVIRRTAQEARRAMVVSLNKNGSGRLYSSGTEQRRYEIAKTFSGRRRAFIASVRTRRGTYQASSPNNPPARLTGTLVRSIRARATRSRRGDYVFIIYADARTAFYRHFLEFGTGNFRPLGTGGNIEPRPFIAPVQRRFAEIMAQRLNATVDQSIREASRP